MAKKVLIVLAEGFEEIEAVTPIDVLRRAGLDVMVAGVGGTPVTGSHGITIEADCTIDALTELPDAVILPGGMPGAENLAKSTSLRDILEKMDAEGRLIGAICAAPAIVLAPAGILDNHAATCYPDFEDRFGEAVSLSASRVVIDGHLVTSRGPGTALEFSLALAGILAGGEVASGLRQGMLAGA